MHSTSIATCTLPKVLVTQMPLYSCQTVSEAMEGGIVEDRRFEGLPEADYYLIEEMLPILPKVCSKNVHILHWKNSQDASLKAKISLLRLRHTFLAILMERKQKSEVHTIKPSVIDHIFNLKIGSERRSMKVCILSNEH